MPSLLLQLTLLQHSIHMSGSSSTETMSKLQVVVFSKSFSYNRIQVFMVSQQQRLVVIGSCFEFSASTLTFFCIVADIPGIIRGAHLNRGLGISFLRHIERCRCLLFVLDLSSPEPWTQFQHLCYELDQYEDGLSMRPQAIVANKMDLPEAEEKLKTLRSLVTQRVIPVSALTGQNTEELIIHLRELYDGNIQEEGEPIRW